MKSTAKVRLTGVIAFGIILSGCGRKEKINISDALIGGFGGSSEDAGETTKTPEGLAKRIVEVTTSTLVSDSEAVDFSVARQSPQALLLSASNLESIMRPIFGISGQISTTDTRYFTPADKRRLGDYMMLEVPNIETIRMGAPVRMSQDYIFTLRTFAGRACNGLVDRETAQAANTANILVKQSERTDGAVSLDKINGFMSRVFDFTPPGNRSHSGAEEFQKVFKESVSGAGTNGDNRTKDQALLQNYKLLCVYVVTDPRSYSR